MPQNVFRALLRMALAVLPAAEVGSYLPAIEFLFGHGPEPEFAPYCQVVQFTLPSRWRRAYPCCFLFQRQDPAARIVRHHFYLAYQNQAFTFPLPLHLADIERGFYSEELTLHCCPPLPQVPGADERCEAHRRHLHGREAVREPEVLTISHAPGGFARTVALDLATGVRCPESEFKGEEIIGLLISPADPNRQLRFPQAPAESGPAGPRPAA